jgi:large subunit ribosomal protein L22
MAKEQKAQLNNLNITPRKVRLIANTLRGLSVMEAEAQLLLRPQRAASKLLKLLRSAAANATTNAGMNGSKLVVSKIWVDPASVLKRSLPRSQGRATPLLKRMSHITIILAESEKSGVGRFTILPKEKKVVSEEKHKDKKAGDIQPKPEKKDEKQKPHDAAPSKGNERGGFNRFFRRKSI